MSNLHERRVSIVIPLKYDWVDSNIVKIQRVLIKFTLLVTIFLKNDMLLMHINDRRFVL